MTVSPTAKPAAEEPSQRRDHHHEYRRDPSHLVTIAEPSARSVRTRQQQPLVRFFDRSRFSRSSRSLPVSQSGNPRRAGHDGGGGHSGHGWRRAGFCGRTDHMRPGVSVGEESGEDVHRRRVRAADLIRQPESSDAGGRLWPRTPSPFFCSPAVLLRLSCSPALLLFSLLSRLTLKHIPDARWRGSSPHRGHDQPHQPELSRPHGLAACWSCELTAAVWILHRDCSCRL